MNEFELINLLTRSLPAHPDVLVGPGDDCAVLDLRIPGRVLLFKTDAVVEGVHFLPETPRPLVGRKALARALSDIAAMAGTPTAALVTLALPKTFDSAQVQQIYDGMRTVADPHQVAIAGGETTTNPDRLLISIALIGWAPSGKAILRSGAKPGDAIFVTGELGGSLAGRHLEFDPRLEQGRWLADNFDLHSMIDLSDGLAGDLRHILNASYVGAELMKDSVPISRAAKVRAKAETLAKPPFLAALTDGEDFELLFTVSSKDAVPVLDGWKGRFPELKLTCIGKVVTGSGITLRDKQGVRPLTSHGYVHFS
jgi:thiamine-monophosphate kinase